MSDDTYISNITNGHRFFVAALSQVRVSVWHVLDHKEHIMDYGGTVEEYSPISIKIMGDRYLRELYEFRTKTYT